MLKAHRKTSGSSGLRAGFCFACERYIGTAMHCGYCGQKAILPPALIQLKRVSWALAIGGLCLLAAGQRDPAPTRALAWELTEQMNGMRAEIVGVVVGRPTVRRTDGRITHLSFLLNDGTGTVRVILPPDSERSVRLPVRDQRLRVRGALRVWTDQLPQLWSDGLWSTVADGERP